MNNQTEIQQIIKQALAEDIGPGDLTSLATVPTDHICDGRFIAKATGVVAGLEVVQLTLAAVDASIEFKPLVGDGARVEPGQTIAETYGAGQSLLQAERLALNFLQRMSGIATMTQQFVEAVSGTRAVILDTRKTVPGLRLLDKWAVQLGGGQNHRIGLYDMALIKDNHIIAAGGITQAVERVRAFDQQNRPIEVEVKNLTELAEVLPLNVDRIMLDNMSLADMRQAVATSNGRIPLEASGNVNLSTVLEIAQTGVDYISVGQLTHSVTALDISFLFE
ncbi:carboxylating nicotinate-nucleotide diphosphorylase [Anaerolineales bacterium HSG24]|nr:carboxylating nicotinate-nucleotide diphosphorylase [Anaerolineales bacterium HSG24]